MKKEYTITIRNPVFYWIRDRRMKKAVKKWNADLDYINRKIGTSEKLLFSWHQLVWQEIDMWIRMGDPYKPKEEFIELVNRRGFDLDQRAYLREMMQHVGMWK